MLWLVLAAAAHADGHPWWPDDNVFQTFGQQGAPFERRNWLGEINFSTPTGDYLGNEGEPYRLSIGGVYFQRPRLAYHVAGVFSYIEANREGESNGGQTFSLGLDVSVRRYFRLSPRWHVYLEGGGGVQVTPVSPYFPADGSVANFTVIGTLGALFKLDDNRYVLFGPRHVHVSNGNMMPDNSGYDGIHILAGLFFRF